MADLTWKETLPSGTSKVGKGPDDIRQHIKDIAVGLGEWLYWPGSGGGSELSGGELKPGASRFFYDVASASSNSDDPTLQNRLFYASDVSALYLYDSTGTYQVGSMNHVEANIQVIPSRTIHNHFLTLSGSTTISNTSGLDQVFINWPSTVKFSEAPQAWAVSNRTDLSLRVITPTNVTTGGFRSDYSYYHDVTGAPVTLTIYWMASGWTTRNL